MKHLAVSVVAMASLAGCSPAQRLVKEGHVAAAADQWPAAYRAYSSALVRKPDHIEARAGRDKAQEVLLTRHGRALEAALGEGRLDAVAPQLRTARDFDPDPAWVRQWQIRWGEAWTDRLEGELRTARGQRQLGDAWVYAATLREFDETDARLSDADTAWDSLRQEEWPSVGLLGSGPQSHELAGAVAVAWRGSAWAEVPLVRTAPLGLDFRVEQLSCRTVKTGTRTETHRYRDGTMVPNPRVPELRDQIRESQAQLVNAQAMLQTRQRAEDDAFADVERTQADLQRFLPSLDAAEQGVVQAAEQRDRSRAAVSEAEEAVQIVAELMSQRSRLLEERRGLGRVRRELETTRATQQDRQLRARDRRDEARQRLDLAQQSEDEARELFEQRQAKSRALDASLKETLQTLSDLEVAVLPEGEQLPPLPKLKERLEASETALEEATNTLASRQAARDRAAQFAQGGDPAAVAALQAAEAALSEQQAIVIEAASNKRSARIAVLQGTVRKLRRKRAASGNGVREAQQAMVQARGAVSALEPLAQSSQVRLDEASQALQGTSDELAAVEDRLRKIERRLPRLGGRIDDLAPIAADLVRRQSDFRRALDIWQAYEADLDEAVRTTAAMTDHQDRAMAVHQQARADRLEATSIVSGWQDRVSSLDEELGSQPARVELVKQAPYTVTQHERTCQIQVDWRVTSPSARARSDRFVATRVDRDETHRANARIRLAEDALDLGQSDAQVLLALRAEGEGALSGRLIEQVRAEGAARRAQAPAAPRDARTRALLISDWMEGGTAIANHLAQAYDLPGEAP